ncbi:MAG: hypothetical protein M5U29_10980 [Anaerolineae bacterium]|nr:hypothetical protein [Anaerolineae bacterium]
MKKRYLLLSIVVFSMLALLPAIHPAQAFTTNIPPNIVLDCAGVTDFGSSFTTDRDNTGTGDEAYTVTGTDGYGNVLFFYSSQRPVGITSVFGSALWTTAPLANPLTLRFVSLAGNGFSEQLVMELTGECDGLPWVDVALPGCDVLMPIPKTAVGGTFVADAPVYWAPGKQTSPLVTIKAGNSARVIGLDSTGEYYQIIWVCDFVWVPRATLGPNYDAVWNGAPLPTAVVN